MLIHVATSSKVSSKSDTNRSSKLVVCESLPTWSCSCRLLARGGIFIDYNHDLFGSPSLSLYLCSNMFKLGKSLRDSSFWNFFVCLCFAWSCFTEGARLKFTASCLDDCLAKAACREGLKHSDTIPFAPLIMARRSSALAAGTGSKRFKVIP